MFKNLFAWLFGRKRKEQQRKPEVFTSSMMGPMNRARYSQMLSRNELGGRPVYRSANDNETAMSDGRESERRRRDEDFHTAVSTGFIMNDMSDSLRNDDSGGYGGGSDYGSSSDSSGSVDFGGGDGGGGGASGDW